MFLSLISYIICKPPIFLISYFLIFISPSLLFLLFLLFSCPKPTPYRLKPKI